MAASKSRWNRALLLQALTELQLIATPLPPTLPPSPPASRSSSPVPGAKRKLGADPSSLGDHHSKRLRMSVQSRSPARSFRPDHTTEDGEVVEDLPRASSSSSSSSSTPVYTSNSSLPTSSVPDSAVPVRRPKSSRPDGQTFLKLYDKWYLAGRRLKYSGDVRFRSTYPPNHQYYTPLVDPPPLNSPYHKFGGIIAQLESIDALISFTYALWCKDMASMACNYESWRTMDAFLSWCKNKWSPDKSGTTHEADKAFYGLIWMIEAFIRIRLSLSTARHLLESTISDINTSLSTSIAQSIEGAEKDESSFEGGNKSDSNCLTPKMLPSPANSTANSTPTSSHTTSETPSSNPSAPSNKSNAGSVLPVPLNLVPAKYQALVEKGAAIPDPVLTAMGSAQGVISSSSAQKLSDHVHSVVETRKVVHQSQACLTLPIMARSFPRTFARMVHSTLDINEEWAPDFEDEEGELFWPGQASNGEGLGWVCLMGKAMIQEFGKPYGYRGLGGVIPKQNLPAKTAANFPGGSGSVAGASGLPTSRSPLPFPSDRSPIPPHTFSSSSSGAR